MPQEKRPKAEYYVIVAFTFILGLVLVGLGRSVEGYLLVLLGVFLGVVGIPTIQVAFVAVVKGLYVLFQSLFSAGRRYKEKRTTVTHPRQQAEQVMTPTDADLVRVVDVLTHCPLPSKFRHEPENDAETWISSQLVHDFPDHKRQQHYSQYHSRFDIEIGNVGVEVKLPKGARDMATLRGQVQIYLKRFKYVVAFIINYYHIEPELIDDFKKDMDEYGGRVVVIERQWR